MKIRSATKSTPSVKMSVLVFIAYKNLGHKKLRTFLTMFGISIGIGAIYFLLSFGIGLQELVSEQVIGNQSIRTIDVATPNAKNVQLNDVTTQRVSEIPSIKEIGKAYFFPGTFKLSNSESDSIVYGIDKGYENLTYLNMLKGKRLSESSDQKPIILNTAALESVGLSKDPSAVLGKTIEVTVPLQKVDEKIGTYTDNFKVIGILESGSGSEIFIPSSIFKNLGVPNLTQLKAGVDNVSNVSKARTQIEAIGFETTSPADTLNEINKVFKFMNIILVGFGGIGMIIAVLGMFNTLTISLLERTKEIGLMVALGARSLDMKRLFIFEALLLSLLGSIVGVSGAFILGTVVNVIMNIFAARRGVQESFSLFANPPLLILGVVAFMTLVGLLVVILPARRAQNIDPIDALRRE